MKFVIPGNPIPQLRHRYKMISNKMIVYDPCSKEKSHIIREIKKQIHTAFNGTDRTLAVQAHNLTVSEYFYVSLSFYFDVPKSTTKTRLKAKLEGIEKHTSKPDLDNLEKLYLDCMTGIIYSDDAKIINLSSKKSYSTNPRTEIEVFGFTYQKNPDEDIQELLKNIFLLSSKLKNLRLEHSHEFQKITEIEQIISELEKFHSEKFSFIE